MGRYRIASLFFLTATLLSSFTTSVSADNITSSHSSGSKVISAQDNLTPSGIQPFAVIADPHDLVCNKCHIADKNGLTAKEIITGRDSIALCETCHAGINLHPVGVIPVNRFPDEDNFILPLGDGKDLGKVVCLTCHYIHQDNHTPYLLRGNNTNNITLRSSLCAVCHKEHFAEITPHTAEKNSCVYCHISTPEKKKNKGKMTNDEIDASCFFCHWSLMKNHYKDLNPLPDPLVQSMIDPASPLKQGKMYCLSCHLHHGKNDEKHLITDEYLELAAVSRNINPHWKNLMCISCHKSTPSKGKPNLLGSGDLNELCNRCHKSEFAKTDIHPVGIIPSKNVKIPTDMPLHNGKITCETCHQSSLQESALYVNTVGRENPNFLRRKDLPRNEFCFLCHQQETYRRLNPHLQVDEQGRVRKDTCLFCHAVIPDVYVFGPENVKFIVNDPNEYCIGCHPGYSQNHPAGGFHLVVPSEKVRKSMETSVQRIGVELPLYNGKIVCATCHNPHDQGVIKYPASATGTQRGNKLRLKPGLTQCTGCHWDKG